jgi:hypothetical protein
MMRSMEIDELIERLKMQRSNTCRIYAGERVVEHLKQALLARLLANIISLLYLVPRCRISNLCVEILSR